MTFDCTIEHTAGKENDIADSLSRMHKDPGISTTKDDLIPYSVDCTTIRPLQDITSYHINLSDHSATPSPTSNHPSHNMSSHRAINFNHVDCNFNNCSGRAETAGHNHSCLYLDEEDMELTSEDDDKGIKKKDTEVSADEEHRPPIPEELFEKYKVPSTNVNVTDRYNNLRIVLSQTPLPFRFTTSSTVTMRNESLDHLIRLLQGTKKPILTPNSHKPLSNEERAAIVRNAIKNIDCHLHTIHTNF